MVYRTPIPNSRACGLHHGFLQARRTALLVSLYGVKYTMVSPSLQIATVMVVCGSKVSLVSI